MSQLDIRNLPAEEILNNTMDGIYVVDNDCRILFWNRAAERITGWKARDVVGKRCSDDILVHVDKAGQQLCDPARCPLHRCIVSKNPTRLANVVFARKKDGGRIPVTISVAPLEDEQGNAVGGVEVFRDESEAMQSLERARLVQRHALSEELPRGAVNFHVLYRPQEMVGGDYYRVQTLPDGRHAFMVADVSGHGTAAALYTMTLRALWQENASSLGSPAQFMTYINQTLEALTLGDSFATAFMGVIDPADGSLVYASAGHPPALLRGSQGELQGLEALNMPLGMFREADFSEAQTVVPSGGILLVLTDGAMEARSPRGEQFGRLRLENILADSDLGEPSKLLQALERALYDHAESVTLEDDLTLMTLSRPG